MILEEHEMALILVDRMLKRRPVWVNSPAGQQALIKMVGLDDDGEIIAYDHEGNDRLWSDYLLTDPRR